MNAIDMLERGVGEEMSGSRIVETDLERICERLAPDLKKMSGRRLLVSGAGGFLGYYLVHTVRFWNDSRTRPGKSIELVACDNFIRGVPDWLEALSGDQGVRLLRHDITQPLPGGIGNFDYVIHAASIASPTFYRRFPIETMDTNVNGLRLLLERCRGQQEGGRAPEGILYFSTSEIYGDPPADQIPTPETFRGLVSCTGPRACYDESKRYGETLCVNFARQYNLPVTMVRPFNNYGPGLKMTDRRVIPDFARDIFCGRDLELLSDGAPTRTFCYVADAVVGYFRVLMRGRAGEAYNIGAEKPELSMLELASLMAETARREVGYEGRVRRGESCDRNYLVDNPQRRCPDISKARRELDFVPEVPIEEGLRRTLLWYRDNPRTEEA